MPDQARTARSRARSKGTGRREAPIWRLLARPHPGSVGPAPTVATENATLEPHDPRRSAAPSGVQASTRAPRRITAMSKSVVLGMESRRFRPHCGTRATFLRPGYQSARDIAAGEDQAFGDGSPDTANSCDRRTRSRCAVYSPLATMKAAPVTV